MAPYIIFFPLQASLPPPLSLPIPKSVFLLSAGSPLPPALFLPPRHATLPARHAAVTLAVSPAVDRLRTMAVALADSPLTSDIVATAISGGVALGMLRLWEETAKRGIFDAKLNRKLVHVSIGLVFMLCWPLFSSGRQGAMMAALIPGINIIRMLLVGLGIQKDEATVKSMSRFGDYRELLKGPLYYAAAITFACIGFWRTSPVGFAAICNLCAGDGFADIVGRRLGKQKLPYNKNKSYAGSIAMATAAFLASVGYMHYFSMFGFIEKSWNMELGFLIVSLVTALVESLPVSTDLDDNLTVPLTSVLVGLLVF